MYSVLVTSEARDQTRRTFSVLSSRFLERTENVIASQLQSLSQDAIDCLKAWPCLLMQEGRGDEAAHLAKVTAVRQAEGTLQVTVEPLAITPPLINDAIWKLRTDLDLEQFEFHRHHWAVKSRSLLDVLAQSQYVLQPNARAQFTEKPLPSPSRAQLVRTIDVLGNWGHTEIDRFLLEVGVDGLDAPRGGGSRRDRANIIVEFAISNPGATTAENRLFSAVLLERTRQQAAMLEAAPLAGPAAPPPPAAAPPVNELRSSNRVFIVHGRNGAARTAVATFLTELGLQPIVLHDQPNMGRHLLTKFIDEAELVTFAVVLMTDDDVGSEKEGRLSPRARQNVILELGYFLSHLGQENVCAIVTPNLETPSDFDGIVYIPMDEQNEWKVQLRRELKAAKMPVIEDVPNP